MTKEVQQASIHSRTQEHGALQLHQHSDTHVDPSCSLQNATNHILCWIGTEKRWFKAQKCGNTESPVWQRTKGGGGWQLHTTTLPSKPLKVDANRVRFLAFGSWDRKTFGLKSMRCTRLPDCLSWTGRGGHAESYAGSVSSAKSPVLYGTVCAPRAVITISCPTKLKCHDCKIWRRTPCFLQRHLLPLCRYAACTHCPRRADSPPCAVQ